jgi:hypothetical protein
MREYSDFAKILEEKIQLNHNNDNNQSLADSSYETGLDYSHMSWLLSQMSSRSHSQNMKSNIKNTVQNTLYKHYKPRPKPKLQPRPTHVLSQQQSLAFKLIKYFASEIKDNFNLKELKQAFRVAALATHPDQGGSPEDFIKIQKAYQELNTVFSVKA